MRHALLCGAAALAAFAPATALAQESGSRPTREYVESAGQSDAFETIEANTALTQSRDPRVKAFAGKMIRDHGSLGRALRQSTARAGLDPPPMGVGADQAPLLSALQSLNGSDFDRTYWRHQMLAHRSALTVAQHYAATGDNPVVRREAASSVPIIAAHLAMAEQMDAESGRH